MATKKMGRRHFAPECKAEVVSLVRNSGKTVGQVARDLDLTEIGFASREAGQLEANRLVRRTRRRR